MSECIICRGQFNATTSFSNQVCSDRCNQLADPKFNLKHYIEKLESENAKLRQENERHEKRWQELKSTLQSEVDEYDSDPELDLTVAKEVLKEMHELEKETESE